MSKTNFSKVEEALNQGLLKMSVQHILDLADAASNLNSLTPSQREKIQSNALNRIQRELKRLEKKDRDVFTVLGIQKDEIQKYLNALSTLKLEDWEKLTILREKMQKYKKEHHKEIPTQANEKLIELERHKHINKRFNVNEKWLPLY